MPTPWFSPHSTFGSSVAGPALLSAPSLKTPGSTETGNGNSAATPGSPPKNPSVSTFLSPLNEQEEQNGQKTDV